MCNYGYFDDEKKEYVITEPLTPRPWINYISNSRLGAFVSQGGGGLAWFHQPVTRRISRYNFMGLPEDRPGFYVYIRELDGTYWNPSFQPCQSPIDRWECRHGMGYTRFIAERKGIMAELTLFVARDDDVLLWDLTLINNRDSDANLFIANFLEFSLFEFYKEILGWIVLRNQIRFRYDSRVNSIKYDYFVYEAEHTNPVFLSTSGSPSGYECDRSAFIGRGRDTSNPIAIENGEMSGSELPGGGLGIGSFAHTVRLKSRENHRIVWILGVADTWKAADSLAVKYQDLSTVDTSFINLKEKWTAILDGFQTGLPDAEMQTIVNVWNPYGACTTFFRCRDISSELPGLSAGIRFRDGMQNCMSMCHLKPDIARERLELLLKHQKSDGSARDSFLPGSKVKVSQEQPRCDNPVWSPVSVYAYLAETGDYDFLNRVLPYYDKGQDRVYDHLMRGLRQIVRDSGDNGLPLLKGRDWDDHLAVFSEEGAESVMTAQNWCYAARLMKEICLLRNETEDALWIDEHIEKYKQALNGPAWDGEWYRQVLFRKGKTALGSKDRRENKIYINTQSWAIISGTAAEGRDVLCMDKMREYLNTDYGIKFLWPPYTGIPEPEDRLVSNGPGIGENGGIFVQANCWAIMAEAIMGRADRAYEYYRQLLPPVISRNIGPDVYLNEPYIFSSHIIADPDPRRGIANLSWLTGAVNWMYIVATQHILGIRPTLKGLRISPCIPSAWKGFWVKRKFRGILYNIEVINENKGNKPAITMNGVSIEGAVLPLVSEGDKVQVKVVL